MSLGTYLRRRRLTKAAQKLASSDDRIIEIAQESGFDSQEAFSRVTLYE
ncbi:MAG: helix-turn-helix domain-containing protein [Bdellovibrionaceae bacterium]|nr:helix-turn-helix domain-containing protein [Pseudobdellovibrionaceae bacterium]